MMKFPFYLQIGETKILLHTLMEPLAFFIGFRYFLWLKKRRGDILKDDNRTWIIIAAIFGALLGSRLVGGFEDPLKLSGAESWLIHFYSNKTVLGGFLGALFAVELVKKIIGVKTASGDLFVYPMLLALIIGRIGCFSMGIYEDTYGYPTVSVFGTDLGDGIARHPVTLYEIFYLMVSWMFLYLLEQKKTFGNGALFKIFMITYIVFRFLLEYIKPHYTYSIGLSAIQIACFMGLIWYAPFIINPWKLLRNPK